MRLSDVLAPGQVVVPLEAADVRQGLAIVIERLSQVLQLDAPGELGRIPEESPVRDLVRIGKRVVLVHRRSVSVPRIAVGLGISPRPLAGEEGEIRVVAVVVGPQATVDKYLQVVSAIARLLRRDEVVDRLVEASSAEEAVAVEALRDLRLPPRLTVRDIMTHRVYRVYADTALDELLSLMSRHRLRAVPVVAEEREVVGIVSDKDILGFLVPRVLKAGAEDPGEAEEQRRAIQSVPVREVMSRSVMCISEDQTVSEVASLMVNKDVDRFPVVQEGRLTGFLTRGDIIRKLFGHLDAT